MKRLFSPIVVLLIVVSLILAACPAQTTPKEEAPAEQAQAPATTLAGPAPGLTPEQQAVIDALQPLLEDPVDPVTLRGL